MLSEIDRLIALADSHRDFVLAALLYTVRDHLEPTIYDQGRPRT